MIEKTLISPQDQKWSRCDPQDSEKVLLTENIKKPEIVKIFDNFPHLFSILR